MAVVTSQDTLTVSPGAAASTNPADALRITQVESIEDLQQIFPQWLAFLDSGVVGQNVHNDPQMIEIALRSQPGFTPFINVLWRDSRIECIAPLYFERKRYQLDLSVWKIWSHPARILRLFGDRVLFAASADQATCMAKLFESLASANLAFDFLTVFGLPETDGLRVHGVDQKALAREAGLTSIVRRSQKTHEIRFPTTFDEYLKGLRPRLRTRVRGALRDVSKDGEFTIADATRAQDVDRLLAWVDQVNQHSWQGRTFDQAKNSDDSQQQILERLASHGWLLSYVLLQDEQPVAFLLGYVYRGVYSLMDCAYDQRCSSSSPGSTLLFVVIHRLITERTATIFDFGFGDMWYKQSLSNVSFDASTVYLVRSKRWRLILKLQIAGDKVYELVRAGLVRMKVDRFIRKLIKRQR